MIIDAINPAIDYGYVFYRHSMTEMGTPTKWTVIDSMNGTSYPEFMDYMTMAYYGETPYLRRVNFHNGLSVLEDQFGFQYYGIDIIPEEIT